MKLDRRLVLTASIGILVTILVYIGLVTSLERPTINRIPLSNEDAISILIDEKRLEPNFDRQDFVSDFVYIKGDGSFYESEVNSNRVGRYLGDSEPTVNAANYFTWKITNTIDNSTYFLDHLNGEIVSETQQ